MKVLIVGGAGYVGSIIRPVLEERYDCHYFDLRPVPGAEARTQIGDVNDDAAVVKAVEGADAIMYLAMGAVGDGEKRNVSDINAAFDVNVRGAYRFLTHALSRTARRFVYASSLSVFNFRAPKPRLEDTTPTNTWEPYGLSKRVGEFLCEAAAQQFPQSTVIALRLMWPRSDQDWPGNEYRPDRRGYSPTGPHDLRRLFVAALECAKPGAFLLNTTGDLEERRTSHAKVREVLGWAPEGK